MGPVVLADLELAIGLEEDEALGLSECAEAQGKIFPGTGSTVLSVASGRAVFCGIGSPVGRAVALGLRQPLTEADLDLVEGFYHERRTRVQLDMWPLADASMRRVTTGRGYHLASFENVCVRGLNPLAPGSLLPPAFGLSASDPSRQRLGRRLSLNSREAGRDVQREHLARLSEDGRASRPRP